jgi:formylmethanofuran dehydrogenase subunit B
MLQSAKYAAIVADAEPAARPQDRDPHRAGALIALAQTLNASSRCALALLRAGGNRSGADAVLTWQTGYPMAVDFFRGHPTYRPYDGSAEARLARGDVDAVLVVGSPALVPPHLAKLMMRVGVAVAGPRASESVFARSVAIVDTGVAGIHEGGTAVRMDDVPVRLGAPLAGPTLTLSIARALGERIVTRQRNAEQGQGAPVLR